MKHFLRTARTLFAISMGVLAAEPATAQDLLTGDRCLACEAVLCLASGQPPPGVPTRVAAVFQHPVAQAR